MEVVERVVKLSSFRRRSLEHFISGDGTDLLAAGCFGTGVSSICPHVLLTLLFERLYFALAGQSIVRRTASDR